jgi:hypothetical protein
MPRMLTGEVKRRFGELSLQFSENLERDGENAKVEHLIDQWDALEAQVGRLVRNDEVLSWFVGIRFERPVTVH